MCGTKRDCILFTLMMIAYFALYTLFLIFIYPYYSMINYGFSFYLGNLILIFVIIILGLIFFLSMIYNTCCCFFKDPGIIPRNHSKFQPVASVTQSNTNFASTDKLQLIEVPLQPLQPLQQQVEVKPPPKKKKFMLFPELEMGLEEGNENNDDIFDKVDNGRNKMLDRNNNTNPHISSGTGLGNTMGTPKIKQDPNSSNIFVPVVSIEKIITESTNDLSSLNGLPSVFTERVCQTCHILRPKLTSHCGYCDNCIMNFDQ